MLGPVDAQRDAGALDGRPIASDGVNVPETPDEEMSSIAGLVTAMLMPEMRSNSARTVRSGAGRDVETQLTLVAGGRLIRQRARESRLARHRDAQRLEAACESAACAGATAGANAAEATKAPRNGPARARFSAVVLVSRVRAIATPRDFEWR